MPGDLFSEDLTELLQVFPNEVLHALRGILQNRWIVTPFRFRYPRAKEAHRLPADADLRAHAGALAEEIRWWGSHELKRQFGHQPSWKEIVVDVAHSFGVVPPSDAEHMHLCQVESLILRKVLERSEHMTPAQRSEAIRKGMPGVKAISQSAETGAPGAWFGSAMAEFASTLRRNPPKWLPRAVPSNASRAAAIIAAAALAAAVAHHLAGPGYRVLRPAVLTVAIARQHLRDQTLAANFGDS
jgi:hypothetical protein